METGLFYRKDLTFLMQSAKIHYTGGDFLTAVILTQFPFLISDFKR